MTVAGCGELGADGRGRQSSLATSELGYVGRSQAAMCVVCTKRSLVEPPTRELQLRPSQRMVQALAETLRWSPRVLNCIGMSTGAAIRPSQAELQTQRSDSTNESFHWCRTSYKRGRRGVQC